MGVLRSVYFEDKQLDQSGGLRISQPIIIGSYVQDKDALPDFIDRVVGGGAPSQSWANGEATMSVPAIAGAYSIAQTKICHPYAASHPGVYDITFANMSLQAGGYKRVASCRGRLTAPYEINDGFYFEADGVNNTYRMVIIKGGVVVKNIPRADWNDKLDGTGASGVNYDFSKFTAIRWDFLYLGGTGVRFFIKIGTRMVLFHEYNHAGTGTGTFVNSPYFHIRWEVRSVGGAQSMQQICGSYSMMGGNETLGKEYGFSRGGIDFVNANTAGTEYMLLAFRLRAGRLNSYAAIRSISTLSTTNDNYELILRINPTFTGLPLTWTTLGNSSIEYAVANNGATPANANIITSPLSSKVACFYATQLQEQLIERPFLLAPGSKIDGTADIITLSTTPLSANMRIYGASNIVEY